MYKSLSEIFTKSDEETCNVNDYFDKYFPIIQVRGTEHHYTTDITEEMHGFALPATEGGHRMDINLYLHDNPLKPITVSKVVEAVEQHEKGIDNPVYTLLKGISDEIIKAGSTPTMFYCNTCRTAKYKTEYAGYIMAVTFCKSCLENDKELQKKYKESTRDGYYD